MPGVGLPMMGDGAAEASIGEALERNRLQIERLNQRGGPTLSIADLIEAGTLTADLAAYLLAAVAEGASVLTAARAGGAGKSTLLANLLAFLPPGEALETVADGRDVAAAFHARLVDRDQPRSPTCWLAHEIGSGHWYGYIWAREAASFLSIPRRTGARIASCLHADTIPELEGILLSLPISAASEDLDAVGLIAFINADRAEGRMRHRVTTVWEASAGGHRLVWEWQRRSDQFVRVGETRVSATRLAWAEQTMAAFLASGEADFTALQRHVLSQYG